MFIALWFVFQVGAALIALNTPDRRLRPDAILFRTRRWEHEGRAYDKLLAVRRWKGLLPDGGAAWKKRGYRKKSLTDLSQENLERFILESARAELTHMLAIVPFWVFGFFAPPNVIWIMLAYALAVNLPCIIAQRYNRPRVRALLRRLYPGSPLA
jgi:glycosyl-4,4'-diaponeurosporenoate acyltransferase